jgi:hypothetical protein
MVASTEQAREALRATWVERWARCTAARYLRKNTSQHLRRTTGIETERRTDYGTVQTIVSICRRATRRSKRSKPGAGRTAAIEI